MCVCGCCVSIGYESTLFTSFQCSLNTLAQDMLTFQSSKSNIHISHGCCVGGRCSINSNSFLPYMALRTLFLEIRIMGSVAHIPIIATLAYSADPIYGENLPSIFSNKVAVASLCSEWVVNQHRDTFASYVGHHTFMEFFAIAENESKARVKFTFLQVSNPLCCWLTS